MNTHNIFETNYGFWNKKGMYNLKLQILGYEVYFKKEPRI